MGSRVSLSHQLGSVVDCASAIDLSFPRCIFQRLVVVTKLGGELAAGLEIIFYGLRQFAHAKEGLINLKHNIHQT